MSSCDLKYREEIGRVFAAQKKHRAGLHQFTAAERIQRLKSIRTWIRAHRAEIRAALYQDLRKPADEADMWEMYVVIREIDYAIRRLRRWMKPKRVRRDLFLLHARAFIRYEPKGQVLIIAPWNFPFQLAMGTFVSALAAGNRIILKPSELAPETSRVMLQLVSDLFPPEEAMVFEGDKTVAIELLKHPFNHVFFTGGTAVGRKIMQAAAGSLASVTLELGGKCPAIVHASADIRDAVGKIVWGKFSNAGQTCVAPDYVVVDDKIHDRFCSELAGELAKRFSCSRQDEPETAGMVSIIDDNHFRRLQALFKDARDKGAELVAGGRFDPKNRCIAPTVLCRINPDARILREEVFGPILPVLSFRTSDQLLGMIRESGSPLGTYVFAKEKDFQRKMLLNTVSGGICFNELVVQFIHPGLPFGGIGESGIGRAHGYAGFKEFSNERPLLAGNRFSPVKLIYPPITPLKQKIIDLVFKYF